MTIIKIVNAISVDFIFDDYDDYDDYELRLPLYYPHIISHRGLSHYDNTLRNTFLIL